MPPVREAVRPGVPEAEGGDKLHAPHEQVHPGELVGGEPPADVPLRGVPQRPTPPRTGDQRDQFGLGQCRQPRLGAAAQEPGQEVGHRPAADVPRGDRTRRHRGGGGAQAEGAQVHPGLQVSVFRRLAQRELVGKVRERHLFAGKARYDVYSKKTIR